MRLTGKVAVIMGCGPNIGTGIATAFAREGARVACNHRRPEAAQRAADKVREAGGEVLALVSDVTDEEGVKANIQQVLATWGKIDVLVNNVSALNRKGVLDMSYQEFAYQTDVMVNGTFLWTKYVAQSMVERGIRGSIINVLTCAAWQGEPGNIGYCTAKGGLANFTRSAAMELAHLGIRVNSVSPTATQPEDEEVIALRRARVGTRPPSPFVNDFEHLIPMGRRPTPSDYAPAFIYLASDESSMVTGIDIKVDGGAMNKYWAWLPQAAR